MEVAAECYRYAVLGMSVLVVRSGYLCATLVLDQRPVQARAVYIPFLNAAAVVLGNQVTAVIEILRTRAADRLLVQPAQRIVAVADAAGDRFQSVRVVIGKRLYTVVGEIAPKIVCKRRAGDARVLVQPVCHIGVGTQRVCCKIVGTVGGRRLDDLVRRAVVERQTVARLRKRIDAT